MVEINALWLTLLINGLAVSTGLLLLWMGYAFWRSRRDYRAMRELAQRVREAGPQRKETLRAYINESCGLSVEQAEQHASEIDQAERQLFRCYIESYLRRDARAAAGYDSWVDEFASQYRVLGPAVAEQAQVAGEAAGAAAAAEASNEAALEAQIEELKHKLAVAYETIDRMLKEYSMMFGGGESDGNVDRDAMIQLVTGSGDDAAEQEAESPTEDSAEAEEAPMAENDAASHEDEAEPPEGEVAANS